MYNDIEANEPLGLNRYIQLTNRTASTESTEMKLECLRVKIDAAIAGIPTERKHNVRLNRTD